jgi:Hg(II)-responsive transcriptional regulator
MRIGEAARGAGVNVQTLRYYERRGLLPAPERKPSGFRAYDAGTVDRVRFIKHAQALGFTLEEIGDLLALRVDARAACGSVEARAKATAARIGQRIAELDRMRTVLLRLVRACRRRAPTGDCPILEALSESEAA